MKRAATKTAARVWAANAVAAAVGTIAIGSGLPSCGGPAFTVTAPDGAADADGGAMESGPPSPSQVTCKGMLIDASSCATCGDPFLCLQNRTECLGSCDACDMKSRACVSCAGAGQPYGACALLDPNGNLSCSEAPVEHCSCNAPSPMACPFDFQVCRPTTDRGDRCFTCGEPLTAALPCRGGGFCSAIDSKCH